MTDVRMPEVVSATGPSIEAEVRAKRQVMQEQAAVMDLPVKLPIEENSRDYSDQIKEATPEQKIEQCKKAQKQNISEKKAATLAKAREAKKEKARLMKLQKNDEGDIMNKLIPMLDERFANVNRRLDDLQTVIAHEGALQQYQIPPATKKRTMESISHPETFIEQRTESQDIPIQERYHQMLNNKRQRPNDVDLNQEKRDNMLYNRRNAEQFKHHVYENTDTEYRAIKNPNQNQGIRAGLDPNSLNVGTNPPQRFVLF